MIGARADLREVLAAVTRLVETELVGFHAAVFLLHERNSRLRLATSSTLPASFALQLESRPLTPTAEPSLAAVIRQEAVYVEDLGSALQNSTGETVAQLEGIRSAWAVPLMEGASCLGSLAVYGAGSGLPVKQQRQFLERYAGVTALAVQSSRTNASISAHEAELRCIYDNVTDVLFSVTVKANCEFLFESANLRFLEATGLSIDQVVGLPVARVIPEPSLSLVMQRYAQAIRERRTVQWEETTPYPAGLRTGEVRVSPVFETDGTCTRLIGSVRDITEHKSLQHRLVRTSRLYAALGQCNQAIVQCDTEQQLFETVCSTAVIYGGMQFAWIGIHDRATSLLKPVAFHGSGSQYIQDIEVSVDAARPTGVGPGGAAFRGQRPIWCQEFLSNSALAAWHERGKLVGWQSMAALPLTCEERPIGVFFVYSKTIGAFDEEAQHLLAEMAMDISFGLTKLHARRERSKERRQLQKLSCVVDQSHNMVMISDSGARITYVNPAFEEVTGYSSCEVLGRSTKMLMSAQTPPSIYSEMRARLKDGARWRGELMNVKKDGTEFICLVDVSPLRSTDGTVSSYVGVGQDITEQRKAEWRIEYLTNFDGLTGLANRPRLRRLFNLALAGATKDSKHVTVMLLDLDYFRFVNDMNDQIRGDKLLKEAAQRLQESVGDKGVACRLSGDEFAVMLPETGVREAADLAQELLTALRAPYDVDGDSITVTGSIGVAMYPEDGADFDTLFRNANLAMYKAKLDGRDCLRSYTEAMHVKTRRMIEIVGKLRRAISAATLEIHYQPQVAGNRIVGAEALVRWNDPTMGSVPPCEFVPIAEESGLIGALDDWVLRNAVRQTKDWRNIGIEMTVCVNVSPVQFRTARFYESVARLLEEYGLPPENLELEITEGAAMHDPENAVVLLEKLHGLGVRIAIDDFGVGYSCLGHLKRFKIDKLKIDQGFVRELLSDVDDRAIVTTIISMAKHLRLEIVAEGVETQEQRKFLMEQGCELVQGYLISRPLPAAEFVAFWRAWQNGSR